MDKKPFFTGMQGAYLNCCAQANRPLSEPARQQLAEKFKEIFENVSEVCENRDLARQMTDYNSETARKAMDVIDEVTQYTGSDAGKAAIFSAMGRENRILFAESMLLEKDKDVVVQYMQKLTPDIAAQLLEDISKKESQDNSRIDYRSYDRKYEMTHRMTDAIIYAYGVNSELQLDYSKLAEANFDVDVFRGLRGRAAADMDFRNINQPRTNEYHATTEYWEVPRVKLSQLSYEGPQYAEAYINESKYMFDASMSRALEINDMKAYNKFNRIYQDSSYEVAKECILYDKQSRMTELFSGAIEDIRSDIKGGAPRRPDIDMGMGRLSSYIAVADEYAASFMTVKDSSKEYSKKFATPELEDRFNEVNAEMKHLLAAVAEKYRCNIPDQTPEIAAIRESIAEARANMGPSRDDGDPVLKAMDKVLEESREKDDSLSLDD